MCLKCSEKRFVSRRGCGVFSVLCLVTTFFAVELVTSVDSVKEASTSAFAYHMI